MAYSWPYPVESWGELMDVFCPKCFSIHTEENMQDYVLAPISDMTGIIVTCPYCDAKYLVTVTFYSLNKENEGEQFNG